MRPGFRRVCAQYGCRDEFECLRTCGRVCVRSALRMYVRRERHGCTTVGVWMGVLCPRARFVCEVHVCVLPVRSSFCPPSNTVPPITHSPLMHHIYKIGSLFAEESRTSAAYQATPAQPAALQRQQAAAVFLVNPANTVHSFTRHNTLHVRPYSTESLSAGESKTSAACSVPGCAGTGCAAKPAALQRQQAADVFFVIPQTRCTHSLHSANTTCAPIFHRIALCGRIEDLRSVPGCAGTGCAAKPAAALQHQQAANVPRRCAVLCPPLAGGRHMAAEHHHRRA